MITLNIKNHTYQFYEFCPREWFKGRFYLGANLFTLNLTKDSFQQICDRTDEFEEHGYITYYVDQLIIIFFYGDITYQIERRNYQAVLFKKLNSSWSHEINHKSDIGMHLLILNNLPSEDENTYHKLDVTHLAGLLMAGFGYHLIKHVLISQGIELTYHADSKSFSNTLTNSLLITNYIPAVNNKSIQRFNTIYFKIKELEANEKFKTIINRVKLSLNWYFQSIEAYDINKFLSIWIALEALMLDGSTDLKIVKSAICNIYRIPIDKVEPQFFIGRLFGLRSRIVHKGLNTGVSELIVEYISCLYLDLLNYSLSIESEKHAQNYLSNKENYDGLTYALKFIF